MDWTPVIVAVVVAVPPTVAAIAAHRKIEAVHLQINSRMSELLKRTQESSHAEGVEDERVRNREGQG